MVDMGIKHQHIVAGYEKEFIKVLCDRKKAIFTMVKARFPREYLVELEEFAEPSRKEEEENEKGEGDKEEEIGAKEGEKENDTVMKSGSLLGVPLCVLSPKGF